MNPTLTVAAALALALTPALAAAQEISITRSILDTLPYTLIYPAQMVASGDIVDGRVTINHAEAPLQCELSVLAVEDTSWTPDAAVAALDDDEIVASWSEALPGFAITDRGTIAYQDATALTYEGTSTSSSLGGPLTLVHTETVSSGRGYVLDCYYAADQAEQARPLVDFIIANFATRSDADCCVGTEVQPVPSQVPTP